MPRSAEKALPTWRPPLRPAPFSARSGWHPSVCEARRLFAGATAQGRVLRRADWRGRRRDDRPATTDEFSGSEIVLGAGSVDGFCEQMVSGAVHDGDVFVGLGGTLRRVAHRPGLAR